MMDSTRHSLKANKVVLFVFMAIVGALTYQVSVMQRRPDLFNNEMTRFTRNDDYDEYYYADNDTDTSNSFLTKALPSMGVPFRRQNLGIILMYHKTGHVMYKRELVPSLRTMGFKLGSCTRRECTESRIARKMQQQVQVHSDSSVLQMTGMPLSTAGYQSLETFLNRFRVRILHVVRPVDDHVVSYYRYHVHNPTPESQFARMGGPCHPHHPSVSKMFETIGLSANTTLDNLVRHCKQLWQEAKQLDPKPIYTGSFINALLHLRHNGMHELLIKLMFYHTIFANEPTQMHGYRSEILTMVSNQVILQRTTQSTRISSMVAPLHTFSNTSLATRYINFMLDNNKKKSAQVAQEFIAKETAAIEHGGPHFSGQRSSTAKTLHLKSALRNDPLIGPIILHMNQLLGLL